MIEEKKYPINEIYLKRTIQGEGPLVGVPTKFVRVAGCDFDHCSWCDTLYAVNPRHPGWSKKMMTAMEIGFALNEGDFVNLITISGGNPALFVDYELLDTLLNRFGFHCAMETQGSKALAPMALKHPALKYLVISPKPPSSGMSDRMDPEIVSQMVSYRNGNHLDTYLKYVIFTKQDLEWVERFDKSLGVRATEHCLSVGTSVERFLSDEELLEDTIKSTKWLVDVTGEQRNENDVNYFYNWRILPQLHTMLWGRKRGV